VPVTGRAGDQIIISTQITSISRPFSEDDMYKGGQRQAISESKDSFQVDNGGLLNYPTALNL